MYSLVSVFGLLFAKVTSIEPFRVLVVQSIYDKSIYTGACACVIGGLIVGVFGGLLFSLWKYQ